MPRCLLAIYIYKYISIYVCILTELINNVLLLFPGYHCGIFLIVKSRDFSFCSDFELGFFWMFLSYSM